MEAKLYRVKESVHNNLIEKQTASKGDIVLLEEDRAKVAISRGYIEPLVIIDFTAPKTEGENSDTAEGEVKAETETKKATKKK